MRGRDLLVSVPKSVKDLYASFRNHFVTPGMTAEDERPYEFTFYTGVFAFASMMLINSDLTLRQRQALYASWQSETEARLLELAKTISEEDKGRAENN